MRLRQLWTASLAGLAILTSATFAHATEGQSNSPTPDLASNLVAVAAFRGPQVEISYDAAFLADLPAATGDAEWECLARAIYFEARGETIKGQFAVAEVILNRVKSSLYPSTICRVVHQAGGGSCQFSFTCDGHSDKIRERDAYTTAGKIARLMLDGAPRALTQGATHFHTRNVRPGWAHRMPRTAMIGQHLFYRVASSR
jgi:spore germination cell wall hydrolase CwlJ-like protein